jgi:putative RNA 2'-phosphotransferase
MDDRELKKLSSVLIGILRHFPDQFGVTVDAHGWADVDDVVEAIKQRLDRFYWTRKKHVVALALTDEKGRYQMEHGRIRATYAHTIVVDLSDLPESEADELFYPVTEEELDIILEQGLLPTDRSMVHLSGSRKKAREAGKIRVDNPVILGIDAKAARADGIDIFKAGADVHVASRIDARYLSRLGEGPDEDAPGGERSEEEPGETYENI